MARACNFHAHATRHIRHLLTTELALTLVCSIYCLSWTTATLCCMVRWCPSQQHSEATARSEHRGTNRSAGSLTVAVSTTPGTVTLAASLPTTIDCKLAVLTYKIRHTSTPVYFSYYIRPRESTRQFRSSTTPLLHRPPTTRTHFADRAFRCSAPAFWNSLNTDTLCYSSLALFKRSLKTFLNRQTYKPIAPRSEVTRHTCAITFYSASS